MPRSTKIGYLELPREIRDQIMELALHPGEVQIHASPEEHASRETHHRYGVQLLATCRQIYEEGHRIWYGKNTFHMTTCSLKEMKRVLGVYQKKHLGMMESLVVECTYQDVPTKPMVQHEKTLAAFWKTMYPGHPHAKAKNADKRIESYIHDEFKDNVASAINQEWRAKSLWLRTEIPNGHCMLVKDLGSNWIAEWPFRYRFSRTEDSGIHLWVAKMELVIGTMMPTQIQEEDMLHAIDQVVSELYVELTDYPSDWDGYPDSDSY